MAAAWSSSSGRRRARARIPTVRRSTAVRCRALAPPASSRSSNAPARIRILDRGPPGPRSSFLVHDLNSTGLIADMRALVAHRQLLQDFAWRDLRSRYKGSALGFGWNFAIPLLQLGVFYLLFGVLFGIRPRTASGEQNYAVFLFVGLLPWTFFANSLSTGASAILANGAIVKKVRLPLQLLPAASVLSSLANFLLSLVVVLGVLAIFGPRHPEGLLVLPLLVAIQIVMNLGFAYQRALLDGVAPEWDRLAYSAVFAMVIFALGFAYFRRSKDSFEEAL